MERIFLDANIYIGSNYCRNQLISKSKILMQFPCYDVNFG